MQTPSIRNRILVPLGAALAVLLSTFVFGIYRIQQNEVTTQTLRQMEAVESLFHASLKSDILRMSALLKMIMRDEHLEAALQTRDQEALMKKAEPLFHEWRREQGITHLYFSGANRVNILRIHMPDLHGDWMDRVTTLEAARTGTIFGGLELGPLGTLTLRVVAPWYSEERLIGFVELGEEINHIISEIRDILSVHILVTIDKKLLDRTNWEAGIRMLGREPAWDQLSSVVIINQTLSGLPDGLKKWIDASHLTSKVTDVQASADNRIYRCKMLYLEDAGGRGVGDLVVLHDITARVNGLNTGILWLGAVCLMIGAALILFFHLLWKRVDKQLAAAQHKILELERNRSKSILDNAIARDISERKRVEEERIRLATAINQVAESVFIADADWKIRYINPAFERISGYTRAEVIGQHPKVFKSGHHDREFYRSIRDSLERGNAWVGKCRSKRKDGTLYEVEATITPVKGKTGEIKSYVAIERDVTHEAELERQLHQAQKLEALGTLAGGIAHDFNNILAAIMGNCEMSLHNIQDAGRVRRHLDQVLVATGRATDLVKQILTFSRQSEKEKKPVRIGLLVKETLKFLRASLPSTIEIRQDVSTAGMVLADPTQIHQVLMNLCTNAAHAMREQGGVLEVILSNVDGDDPCVPRPADLVPGLHLRLTVSDTGQGIDPSIMDRIFDPYFTTKRPGEGTGLGLAVVHGIVKSHGGVISVQSEPGATTAFHVYLPTIDTWIAQEAEPITSLPRGTERILFVDDERSLIEVSRQMLEYLGYTVATKSNGLEALEIFRASPEQFDLVITDQTMPHMTGIQLAEELQRIRPGVPVILCTGFSERILAEHDKSATIRELLIKPVVMQQLAETIRKVLDTRSRKGTV